eukprot:13775368-Alexandrium_andersonii.AAC.1
MKKRKRSVVRPSLWANLRGQGLGGDKSEQDRPLVVNVAGFTCTDWTGLGGQARAAGLHERHQ